jgi:hypothetical protein
VFFKINLSLELRNHIIGQIYKKLFSSGISSVNCQADWLDIVCFYQGKGQDKIIQQLRESYRATFTQEESRMKFHNYRLKLKIIQAEQLDGLDIQLGLDQLGASVSDLFDFGVRKLILDNKVSLSEAKVDLSSLAEPEILINLDTAQTIEIGSQIPFQNISTQGAAVIAPIDWKFAGLKIQTTLSESYGKLLLNYSTEFSRPIDNTISGSKEIASALVEPNIPIKLFQIGFQTSSKSTKGIPLLSDIPVLKHLFESKSNQNSYKQIYGYLIIEKVE